MSGPHVSVLLRRYEASLSSPGARRRGKGWRPSAEGGSGGRRSATNSSSADGSPSASPNASSHVSGAYTASPSLSKASEYTSVLTPRRPRLRVSSS
ncbi:Os07g0630666 [Oryza sativa Japonica Group]|uniref:Os07g0630666 protein n=1 Tax=Oryza sativa subsp. japonica TaxID=39947 RepID=A0A0P0X9E0_ORYSJ|nr:Os07g0630666 [Oryza sativa Japonica Group]